MLSTLDAARQISDRKLLLHSIFYVLTQCVSNDFQQLLYHIQCRQTLAVVVRVLPRGGISIWQSIVSGDAVSYREGTKQPRCPIAGLLLFEFAAGNLIRYLHGSYILPLSFRRRFLLLFFIYHLFLSLGSAVH